jgi:hypothetical protein
MTFGLSWTFRVRFLEKMNRRSFDFLARNSAESLR